MFRELEELSDLMVDPHVTVMLMDGSTMCFPEISAISLGKRLTQFGFVLLSSGDGDYTILWKHGVSAITTTAPCGAN
jgi:hypothetical protein|tara:strand:- start:2306 stop:2536 length:231 start_codon:yes stop_codon:yes gene_type:complete